MGILSGFRVLDFTQYQAGPYGAALLADFGADVIKIERPSGDPGRANQPLTDGVNAFFLVNNRGKRSLGLDLTKPAALEIVRRLIARSDVLAHNLRPGTMEKLGLGYEDARKVNPRLVYAAVSTYGPKGAKRDRAGVDLIAQAESGIMSVTGEVGGRALPVGAAVGDALGGVNLAFAVVAALLARERTGCGQAVHVSLVGGLMGLQAWEMQQYLLSKTGPPRGGGSHPLIKTLWQGFRAQDGEFVIAEVSNSWVGICRAIGRPDLASEERYRSVGRRLKHRAELLPVLEGVFGEGTVQQWVDRLRAEGVMAAAVRGYGEIAADPDTRADGYIRTVDHPDKGPIEIVGPFLHFAADPPEVRAAAPAIGQHSREILGEAGYEASEIERLFGDGVAA